MIINDSLGFNIKTVFTTKFMLLIEIHQIFEFTIDNSNSLELVVCVCVRFATTQDNAMHVAKYRGNEIERYENSNHVFAMRSIHIIFYCCCYFVFRVISPVSLTMLLLLFTLIVDCGLLI